MPSNITYDGSGNILSEVDVAPPPPAAVDRLTFLRMFSNGARAAAEMSTEPDVRGLWPLLYVAAMIRLDDPDVQAAFAVFVYHGIVTAEEIEEIVDSWPVA